MIRITIRIRIQIQYTNTCLVIYSLGARDWFEFGAFCRGVVAECSQQERGIEPMLFLCCASVYDAGPTL